MLQIYNVGVQLLETGTDLVSPHLRWLIRNMLVDYLSTNKLDLVCYRVQTPDDCFGEAHSPSRSITLNLLKHFDDTVPKLEEGDNKYTSLKCMLLKELLDTAAHEGHHLLASHTADNWDNSDLEEQQATEKGEYLSWRVAKHYDVEIEHFGPVLDDAISEFIMELRANVALAEENEADVEEWMELQIHMFDNKLAFYNPAVEKSVNFREAFEVGAEDEDPWIDTVKKFIDELPVIEPTGESVAQPMEQQPAPAAMATNPVIVPATTAPIAEMPMAAQPQIIPTSPAIGVLNDDLMDVAPCEEDATEALENAIAARIPDLPAPVAPAPAPVAPAAQAHQMQPAQQAPPAVTDNSLIIVEAVLRRLFHHVQSKCEFNSEGGYNNPYAVLEGVAIADIPGAQDLFVAMDTTDTAGVFAGQQQCNGMIKGLVSKDFRPRYTLYLNMGGQLHKRTFISQNPDKVDGKGNLTPWSAAARQGKRIMMLLQDVVGPRADIQLEATETLGQEKFNLWNR